MMKFEIGDVVEFKSWQELEKEFGLTQNGDINMESTFPKERKKLCGQKGIVVDFSDFSEPIITFSDTDTPLGFAISNDMLKKVRKEDYRELSNKFGCPIEILKTILKDGVTIDGIKYFDFYFSLVDGYWEIRTPFLELNKRILLKDYGHTWNI